MIELESLKQEMKRFGIEEKGIHYYTSVYFNEYVAAIGVGKTDEVTFEDVKNEAKKFHNTQIIKGILVKTYNKKSEDDIEARERRVLIGERIPISTLINECERVGHEKSYFDVEWLRKYQRQDPSLEYIVERDPNDLEKMVRGVKLRKGDIVVRSEEDLEEVYKRIKSAVEKNIASTEEGQANNIPVNNDAYEDYEK